MPLVWRGGRQTGGGLVDPDGSAPAIKVFLLDDHEVVRRGVTDVLESDSGITVIGEAKNAAEALARVPALRPDVAVLDVRLPDGDGVTVCRELRSRMPELKVIMLRPQRRRGVVRGDHGRRIRLSAQADPRPGPGHRRAHGGRRGLAARPDGHDRSAGADAPCGRAGRPPAKLSDQERTVLELIGEGLTNRQIGERMFLAEKTVKNYVSHLLAKLGLERRTQAAVLATKLRDAPSAGR